MAWLSMLRGGKKVAGAIRSLAPAKNLSTKRSIQDKVVKAVDEGMRKGLGGKTASPELKQSLSKSKRVESKRLKDLSYKWDELVSKQKKNLKESKTLIKAAGATAVAGAGAAGVSLYNKKRKNNGKPKI